VDRFILAALEQKKLTLSPQADAQRLVRRFYFDLIGLPPTPEEVEAFVKAFATNSQTAVAALVDELLASPHYGERWARHWLDVARYADSDGSKATRTGPTRTITAISSSAASMMISLSIRSCAGNSRAMNWNRTIRRPTPRLASSLPALMPRFRST
jgi:hypothetical protein